MTRKKIFLGNCTDDLMEHRSQVYDVLCNVDSDWICVRSEDVEVNDTLEKYQESQNLISNSELCIFLVGHLYTNDILDNGTPLHIAEFHFAEEARKDILAFVASERFAIQARYLRNITTIDELKRQREFRKAVQKKGDAGSIHITVIGFDSLEDLRHKVEVEFHKWLRAQNISIPNKTLYNSELAIIIPKYSRQDLKSNISVVSPKVGVEP